MIHKSEVNPYLTNFCLFADRLFLPSILVLNHCGISKAGDRTDIAAFCAHVVELDLSHNQLNDWVEVGVLQRLLTALTGRRFISLKSNEEEGGLQWRCLWWVLTTKRAELCCGFPADSRGRSNSAMFCFYALYINAIVQQRNCSLVFSVSATMVSK